MNQIKIKLRLTKTTPGALRYQEIREDNPELVHQAPNEPGCKMGTIYIRKTAFRGGEQPHEIEAIVTF